MSNKTKSITISEYAKQIGITRQGVLYRINNKLNLPNVIKYELVGATYILTVNLKK